MPARKNLTGRPASSSAALSEMSNFLSRRAQQASQKKSSRKASAKKTLDAVLAALKPHLKAHRNSSSAVKASFAGVIKKFNSTRNDLEQVQRKCQRAVNGIETNRALAVDSFKIKVGAA